MIEVNTSQLAALLMESIRVGNTAMVTSSPGLGKSQVVHQVAKELNLKVVDRRVSQLEPVDFQGYPDKENGRMVHYPPQFIPLEGDKVPDGYDGWLLFLDEFNSGSKQTESAAYRIILDREVNDYKVHPNCSIIAAGNLMSDRAIVNELSTATKSRMSHFRLSLSVEEWIKWANKTSIDHRIISFIKFKPAALNTFDPKTIQDTFACPRTWEMASRYCKDKPDIDTITKIAVAGSVGEGTAVEFYHYTQIYQNLPTIEDILKNPTSGWKVPKEPSEQYAVTTMLSHNVNKDTLESIMKAMDRLPLEFRVLTLKDIYARHPKLKRHPLIVEWTVQNSDAMF